MMTILINVANFADSNALESSKTKSDSASDSERCKDKVGNPVCPTRNATAVHGDRRCL